MFRAHSIRESVHASFLTKVCHSSFRMLPCTVLIAQHILYILQDLRGRGQAERAYGQNARKDQDPLQTVSKPGIFAFNVVLDTMHFLLSLLPHVWSCLPAE